MTEVGPGGCKARSKRTGQLCRGSAIAGTNNCRMHPGGPIDKVKARGQVVLELRRWGLAGEELRDPGQTLLQLMTQSALRVEFYSSLLGEAYEAAERLKHATVPPTADEVPGQRPNHVDADRAAEDLDRIFTQGGVAALIGYKYGAAGKEGHLYAAEEAIRGLVRLEAEERDRCATMAAKAVAAGLAERQVRLAEQQGALVAELIRGTLTELGLDPAAPEVMRVVSSRLRALAGAA